MPISSQDEPRRHGLLSRDRVTTTGAAGVTAAVAAFVLWRSMRPNSHPRKDRSLVEYLRDHLSGSDVAIQTVQRLASTSPPPDADVFRTLVEEFEEERTVVRALLVREGASPRSPKRAVAAASGAMLRLVEGDGASEVMRFLTLEGLAVGIQGKRCLWRTLQALAATPAEGGRFQRLEAQAIRQWEAVDARRRMLAISAFRPLAPHP